MAKNALLITFYIGFHKLLQKAVYNNYNIYNFFILPKMKRKRLKKQISALFGKPASMKFKTAVSIRKRVKREYKRNQLVELK